MNLVLQNIEKVGLYIPGGTAPLFSTVLMLAVPAKIAGCKEIVPVSYTHLDVYKRQLITQTQSLTISSKSASSSQFRSKSQSVRLRI